MEVIIFSIYIINFTCARIRKSHTLDNFLYSRKIGKNVDGKGFAINITHTEKIIISFNQ